MPQRLVVDHAREGIQELRVVRHARGFEVTSMRPVAAPEQAIGRYFGEAASEWNHVLVGKAAAADAVGAGELHPEIRAPRELEQDRERLLVGASAGIDTAEMVDHHVGG